MPREFKTDRSFSPLVLVTSKVVPSLEYQMNQFSSSNFNAMHLFMFRSVIDISVLSLHLANTNLLNPIYLLQLAYLAYLELQRKSYFPQQLVTGEKV